MEKKYLALASVVVLTCASRVELHSEVSPVHQGHPAAFAQRGDRVEGVAEHALFELRHHFPAGTPVQSQESVGQRLHFRHDQSHRYSRWEADASELAVKSFF